MPMTAPATICIMLCSLFMIFIAKRAVHTSSTKARVISFMVYRMKVMVAM